MQVIDSFSSHERQVFEPLYLHMGNQRITKQSQKRQQFGGCNITERACRLSGRVLRGHVR